MPRSVVSHVDAFTPAPERVAVSVIVCFRFAVTLAVIVASFVITEAMYTLPPTIA